MSFDLSNKKEATERINRLVEIGIPQKEAKNLLELAKWDMEAAILLHFDPQAKISAMKTKNNKVNGNAKRNSKTVLKGKVKYVKEDDGRFVDGFIKPDNGGSDFYFRSAGLSDKTLRPEIGDEVSFEIGESKSTDKSPPAINVTIINKVKLENENDDIPLNIEKCLILNQKMPIDEIFENEFKSLSKDPAVSITRYCPKYLSAFMNGNGGNLYYGIEDDGTVRGLPFTRSNRDRLRLEMDKLMRRSSPSITPDLCEINFIPVLQPNLQYLNSLQVVWFKIKKGCDDIYCDIDKKAYVKMNGSVIEMPIDQVRKRVKEIENQRMMRDESVRNFLALSGDDMNISPKSISRDIAQYEAKGFNRNVILETLRRRSETGRMLFDDATIIDEMRQMQESSSTEKYSVWNDLSMPVFMCPHCGQKMGSQGGLNQHLLSCAAESLPCQFCSELFRTDMLDFHQRKCRDLKRPISMMEEDNEILEDVVSSIKVSKNRFEVDCKEPVDFKKSKHPLSHEVLRNTDLESKSRDVLSQNRAAEIIKEQENRLKMEDAENRRTEEQRRKKEIENAESEKLRIEKLAQERAMEILQEQARIENQRKLEEIRLSKLTVEPGYNPIDYRYHEPGVPTAAYSANSGISSSSSAAAAANSKSDDIVMVPTEYQIFKQQFYAGQSRTQTSSSKTVSPVMMEEDLIPCEFCDKLLSFSDILTHQRECLTRRKK